MMIFQILFSETFKNDGGILEKCQYLHIHPHTNIIPDHFSFSRFVNRIETLSQIM